LWSQTFLILSCVLSSIYIYRRLNYSPIFYLAANLTLLLLVVGYIFKLVDPGYLDFTIEMVFLSTIISTLITLLVSVRVCQPKHLRYPIFYSLVPVILLPFYWFYIENQSLADLTMIILQTAALIVYTLLIVGHQKGLKNGWLLFISLFCFSTALLFNWALNIDYEWMSTLLNLLLSAGIITSSMSFPGLINKSSR